ncbi:MAG: multiheme c-type cytochrome [Nitrospirota bacterium]
MAHVAWAASAKYVGVAKCASSGCHGSAKLGNQKASWEESKHAEATSGLSGKKGKQYAAALGIDDPAESDLCMSCHSTAWGVEESRLALTFDPEEGVQCEGCHGAGSDYIDPHKKENADFAAVMAKGMRDLRTEKQREELCGGCHRQSDKYDKLKKSEHPKPSAAPLKELEDKMEEKKHWKEKASK